MSDSGHRPTPPPAPPDSVVEAVERAQLHAMRALVEAVTAGRALLDAVSLGINGVPAASHPTLSEVARTFDQLTDTLQHNSTLTSVAARTLLTALDGEISRWEERSRGDADARAVLRTFLGLRELLWEIGLRHDETAHESPKTAPEPGHATQGRPPVSPPNPPQAPARTTAKRVQRVTIEG